MKMTKLIQPNMQFDDGNIYTANREQYDIYLEDSFCSRDDFHLKYMFDYGKYEMPIAFYLKNKKNITLDFCGATLKFHGQIQPFILENCENICIENCVVEYDRSAYSEAEITEITEEYIRLKFSDNCPYRIQDKGIIFTSDTWEGAPVSSPVFFQVFDKHTRKGIDKPLCVIGEKIDIPMDNPFEYWHFLAEEDHGTVILRGAHPPKMTVGNIVCIAHEPRWLTSLTTIGCKNIHIRNFRILNGFGLGIAPYYTENLYIDRLIATCDARSHGLISNAADLIHSVGGKGELIIKNSIFEGMIDDAINVHSNFLVAVQGYDHTLLVKSAAQLPIRFTNIFRVGDQIALYRGSTMEQTCICRIEQIHWIDNNHARITTDIPMQAMSGDLIENLSTQVHLTIKDCLFGKANTHIRLQTRGNILIENCSSELPIFLSGDVNYWYESSPVQNLTIRNCTFAAPRAKILIMPEFVSTPQAPYYHKNIKILENKFLSETPMIGKYSDGIAFTGNTNSEGKVMHLKLINCGSCEYDNCIVERKTEVQGELRRGS